MEASDRVEIGDGLEITRLGVGTAAVLGFAGVPIRSEIRDALSTAIGLGIRFIDTAPQYKSGDAERLVAEVLTVVDPPEAPVVSTRVGWSIRPATLRNVLARAAAESRVVGRPAALGIAGGVGRAVRRRLRGAAAVESLGPAGAGVLTVLDYRPEAIEATVAGSAERLGLASLPMVFLHDPQHQRQETLRAAWRRLEVLRADGQIRLLGVAGDFPDLTEPIVSALRPDVVLAAGGCSLLDPAAGRRLLPTAHRLGIPVIAAGVLGTGLLADPAGGATYNYRPATHATRRRAQMIEAVCERHGVPLLAAAMRFPFRQPAVRSVIVGVRDPDEVRKDVAAFGHPVPEALWTALRSAGLIDL